MDRDKWPVSLNPGGTLSFPASIARAWGIKGQATTLWFIDEGDYVAIVPDSKLSEYLQTRSVLGG